MHTLAHSLSLSLFPNAAECSTWIDSNPQRGPFILKCVRDPVGDRIYICTQTCVKYLTAAGVSCVSPAPPTHTHTRDKCTLNTRSEPVKQKPPLGMGSRLSSTEQSSQGSRLDPVCFNTIPCQGLCFWRWQLSAAG